MSDHADFYEKFKQSDLDNQQVFRIWIETCMPYLNNLFDFEKMVYIPEMVDAYLGVASHGQAIMARFALSVWTHNDDFEFNFIEAAQVLDTPQLNIIIDWLKRPIWP